jgi:alcohol dehydrogenase
MSARRHDWHMPVEVHLGTGLLAQYQPTAPVLVLADVHALPADLAGLLQTRWQNHCVAWVWQEQGACELATLEALAQTVWQALDAAPEAHILAIGGGTTLDMAKILRWRPLQKRASAQIAQLWRMQGLALDDDVQRHTLLCWPSTAGTGSEVSASATLWDRSSTPPQKLAWQPAKGHADQAWIDPALCVTCPPKVTRDCALDALAHALESLWNHRANCMTRPLAHEAVALVLAHLPTALAQPLDLAARTRLSEAALLAGLAMAQTQTALAHALSYDLTLREGMVHGEAVAVWLPFVAELACQGDAQMRTQLQQALRTQQEPAEHLRQWLSELGIQTRGLHDLPRGQDDVLRALGSPRGKNQRWRASDGI